MEQSRWNSEDGTVRVKHLRWNSKVEHYRWKSQGETVKWNSNGGTFKVEQCSFSVTSLFHFHCWNSEVEQ